MKNEGMQTEGNEFGLVEAITFLKNNWKGIILGGLVGLLFSVANYAVLTPKRYEARWQVQMADFGISKVSNNKSEDPAALIQRLRMPTVYTVEVQQTCGMPTSGEYGDYLNGSLKVIPVKNVANVAEMTLTAPSPESARKCAEAIVAMIVAQQRRQIEESLAGRQAQVAEYQQDLLEEQQQLEKIKKSELGNFGYLAKLDRLSWLRERIDALHEEALQSQMHPAKLVAPIYVPSKPASPKLTPMLLLGAMLGMILGVLFPVGRVVWRKMA